MNNDNGILSEIIEIERQELNGKIDDSLYLKKIELLCILSKRDVEKVWGEYGIVQQITSQPVLMNKAMSIPLTKNEVSQLLDDLRKKYYAKLKANYTENVNLVFSTNIRGHAKDVSKEIVLPKLGDWRFGYKNLYSAELIFHEFAHLMDYGRIKVQKYGKTDIHKHDFVRILDNLLVDYQNWIESKYVPIRQREQILNNSELLVEFHVNREEIESKDKERELIELAEKEKISKQIQSEAGVSENSFPIHLLMQEDTDDKLNYLQFVISYYEKIIPVSLVIKSQIESLRNALKEQKSILNKEQINLLIKAIDRSKLNDYLLELPLMKQLKMSSILRKFNDEIRSLSLGKIASLEDKSAYKIRTYEDAERLRKRGMED